MPIGTSRLASSIELSSESVHLPVASVATLQNVNIPTASVHCLLISPTAAEVQASRPHYESLIPSRSTSTNISKPLLSMEILHESPTVDSFTPLTTHQSQTPSSFYSGPPVLHYHTSRAQLVLSEQDLDSSPALSNLRSNTSNPKTQATSVNGHPEGQSQPPPQEQGTPQDEHEQILIPDIDVWVTSE